MMVNIIKASLKIIPIILFVERINPNDQLGFIFHISQNLIVRNQWNKKGNNIDTKLEDYKLVRDMHEINVVR